MSVTLHTNYGNLKLELYCEDAPVACKNFIGLCASGYYNNKIFHRNIKNFIIQCRFMFTIYIYSVCCIACSQ